MDKHYELKYHELEENNWWFKARKDMIFKILQKLDINKHSKILDIGCSSGVLNRFLERNGFKKIYGVDVSEKAVSLCKKKGMENVFVMDGAKLKFDDEMFDVVISSDILEHIRDHDSALAEWNRVLKPDGKLIVFVPAFNFLWGEHDEVNQHYKRYSKSALVDALKKANFQVERSSYWDFSLFFPTCLLKIFQRIFLKNKNQKSNRLHESVLFVTSPVTNKFLLSLLKFENRLLKRLNFPFGVSVFAVAKKYNMKNFKIFYIHNFFIDFRNPLFERLNKKFNLNMLMTRETLETDKNMFQINYRKRPENLKYKFFPHLNNFLKFIKGIFKKYGVIDLKS